MDNKILLGAGFVKALGKSWPVNTRAFPLSIRRKADIETILEGTKPLSPTASNR